MKKMKKSWKFFWIILLPFPPINMQVMLSKKLFNQTKKLFKKNCQAGLSKKERKSNYFF